MNSSQDASGQPSQPLRLSVKKLADRNISRNSLPAKLPFLPESLRTKRFVFSQRSSLNAKQKDKAKIAQESLSTFIRQAWPIIEPKSEYLQNWHIDAISEHLQAITDGKINKLLINMPPRHGKSILVSVMWPVWEWIRNPSGRWLFASYAGSLSTKHSLDRRTILQSEWYKANWGHVFRISGDQNLKTEYQNDRRGVMVATSVGGTATGKGGSRIVVDDPHNPMEAESDVQRESAIRFFDLTLSTRLDDLKTGAIVVVMQRVHEKDLSGHLLNQGGWEHLCLPSEYDGSDRTV